MHLFVALDDMDVHLPEIAVILLQYTVCLLQEPSDKVPRAGHGCVDHDSEIRDLPYLPRLLRLDQRHVPVQREPIAVKAVVESVRICSHFLSEDRKLPQKLSVILPLPVLHPELSEETAVLLRRFFREGLQIRLHLFIDLLPFLSQLRVLLLFRVLVLPVTVVVCPELFLKPGKLLLREFPGLQLPEDPLRVHHPLLVLQLPVRLPAQKAPRPADRPEIAAVDQMLRRNVAA